MVMRSSSRTATIREYLYNNQVAIRAGDIKIVQIAELFGVTRQRIGQIAEQADIDIHKEPGFPSTCAVCGLEKRVKSRSEIDRPCKEHQGGRIFLECDFCHKEYSLEGRQRSEFLNNRRLKPQLRRNCCPGCEEWGWKDLECAGCGKPIRRLAWMVRAYPEKRWCCRSTCGLKFARKNRKIEQAS